MTLTLDLTTVVLICAVLHVTMTCLLAIFWRRTWRRGNKAGFGWWVAAEAMMALGIALLLLSAVVPPWVVLLGNNGTFFVAMPLLETGQRIWFGRRLWPAMTWRWAGALCGFLAWLAFWQGGADYATRAVVFSLVTVAQAVLMLQFFVSAFRRVDRGAREGLGLMIFSGLMVLAMSAWRAQASWPFMGSEADPPGLLLAALLVSTMVAAVVRVAAMLLMLHGRTESRLRSATKELERRANVDDLTQVASRAHFKHSCDQLLAQAHASRIPVCLLVCDMDGFKRINDQLGHPEGDDMLARFAQVLRATVRRGDLAGRLGGDEFAVLFYNCHPATAMEVAERLRQRVGEITAADGRALSMSGGLTVVAPQDGFDQAYLRADQALYAAKAAGRNRVLNSTG